MCGFCYGFCGFLCSIGCSYDFVRLLVIERELTGEVGDWK
jgi:hypothetical protein